MQAEFHVLDFGEQLTLFSAVCVDPLCHVYSRVFFRFSPFMVALCNRADHYIFILWFLSSSIFCFYSSPNPELYMDWIHPWIGLDWIGLDWIGLDWVEIFKNVRGLDF